MTRVKRSATLAMVAVVVAFLVTATVPAAGGEAATTEDGQEPGLFSRVNRARLEWIAGTDAWIHAGPAFSFVTLLDTRMSPIVYAGPGGGVLLSADVVGQRWLWPNTLTARLVNPTGTAVLPGSYESWSGEADVAFLYRFIESGFAAGGGVRSSIHVRADVPVVSWISRSPAYAIHGSAPYLAPPTRYVRATIESGLTWPLRWSDQNTARIATHTLSLSLGTRSM